MKKALFYKFENDEDFESIGVASSDSEARKAVGHFIEGVSDYDFIEVYEEPNGFFATVINS